MEGFDANVVKKTLETNYYGTLEASRSFLPLLRDGGRLVNVSSRSGVLNKYSDEITSAFREAAKTDIDSVTAIMQRFQKAIDENRVKEDGFSEAAYAVSKAGETAMTMVLAMEEKKKGRGVLVNSCCPGYTNTDMTKGRGRKTVDQGAKTPVKLALEDIGGVQGEFWEHEDVSQW
jgi:carbonyl reductase 1